VRLGRGAARWSGPKVRRSGATASGRAAGLAGKKIEEGREEGDGSDWWDRRVREREREGGRGRSRAGEQGKLGRAWLGRVERRGERGEGC
jgi:hypothetical protein